MKTFLKTFAQDESGATAIEYGLIVGLMALALVTALNALGGKITGVFTKVAAAMPT